MLLLPRKTAWTSYFKRLGFSRKGRSQIAGREETKGRFCKRVVLVNVPSFSETLALVLGFVVPFFVPSFRSWQSRLSAKTTLLRVAPVRFGYGTVRAVPDFGFGGSSGEGFSCVSVLIIREGRFRFRFLESETGRIRFGRARFQTPNSVSVFALTEFRGESSVSSP